MSKSLIARRYKLFRSMLVRDWEAVRETVALGVVCCLLSSYQTYRNMILQATLPYSACTYGHINANFMIELPNVITSKRIT